MESGIWVSTQTKMRIAKDGISFLVAILHEYIVAEYFRQRAGLGNTNILILKKERQICMA